MKGFNKSDWLKTRLFFPDGSEVPRSHIPNEFHFRMMDLGKWNTNRELSRLFFKVKLYPSSGCISISGLKVPEGAAGPTGRDYFVDSPERLQQLVLAAFAGRWEEAFPGVMTQHNRSVSRTARGQEIIRDWDAKTRSVTDALLGMGHSREYIPWGEFERNWRQILRLNPGELVPGLRVYDQRFPQLGLLELLGKRSNQSWVARRAIWQLTTAWFGKGHADCECRMVVAAKNLVVVDPFGTSRSPANEAALATGYTENTWPDPRHIEHDRWLSTISREKIRNSVVKYNELYGLDASAELKALGDYLMAI